MKAVIVLWRPFFLYIAVWINFKLHVIENYRMGCRGQTQGEALAERTIKPQRC